MTTPHSHPRTWPHICQNCSFTARHIRRSEISIMGIQELETHSIPVAPSPVRPDREARSGDVQRQTALFCSGYICMHWMGFTKSCIHSCAICSCPVCILRKIPSEATGHFCVEIKRTAPHPSAPGFTFLGARLSYFTHETEEARPPL